MERQRRQISYSCSFIIDYTAPCTIRIMMELQEWLCNSTTRITIDGAPQIICVSSSIMALGNWFLAHRYNWISIIRLIGLHTICGAPPFAYRSWLIYDSAPWLNCVGSTINHGAQWSRVLVSSETLHDYANVGKPQPYQLLNEICFR